MSDLRRFGIRLFRSAAWRGQRFDGGDGRDRRRGVKECGGEEREERNRRGGEGDFEGGKKGQNCAPTRETETRRYKFPSPSRSTRFYATLFPCSLPPTSATISLLHGVDVVRPSQSLVESAS